MKTTRRKPSRPRRLRKGLRIAIVAVAATLVVGASVSAYYVFDLLGSAGYTDVDVEDEVTVPPGSLDDISDPPTESPEATEAPPDEPDLSVTPGTTPAPAVVRRWGTASRCRVYVVPSIPIRKVAQRDEKVLNILVYGTDARSAATLQARTDTMMIATVDQVRRTIKLTSLLRDTRVDIEGRSLPAKLNAAYVYGGVGLLINTINRTFDLDIQKFVMIDMWSAEDVIQMAGGVTVNVTAKELSWLNLNINETNRLFAKISPQSPLLATTGTQLLNGRQAVAYGRIRKADSDFYRTGRQRTVAKALLAAFWKASLSQKDAALRTGFEAVNTNLTTEEMLGIALSTFAAAQSPIKEYRIPWSQADYKTDLATYDLVLTDLTATRAALHEFLWGGAVPPTEEPAPTDVPEATPTAEPTSDPSPEPTSAPTATEPTPNTEASAS